MQLLKPFQSFKLLQTPVYFLFSIKFQLSWFLKRKGRKKQNLSPPEEKHHPSISQRLCMTQFRTQAANWTRRRGCMSDVAKLTTLKLIYKLCFLISWLLYINNIIGFFLFTILKFLFYSFFQGLLKSEGYRITYLNKLYFEICQAVCRCFRSVVVITCA